MIDNDKDCATWSLYDARRYVIGVDVGFKADHSALIVAGEFPTQAGDVIGIQKIIQFPLGESYDEVIGKAAAEYVRILRHNRPCVLAVDSRNNLPFIMSLIRQGGVPPLAVLGMNLTAAERNSIQPTRVSLGAKMLLREFNLGRTPMFNQLASEMRQQHVRICDENSDRLLGELAGLQREVTRSGNVTISCPVGGHDDLAVSVGYACFVLGNLSARLTDARARCTTVLPEKAPSHAAWT
jgi:hypothetical protein